MCCTLLAANTGRKKSPSGHYRTTLSGYIFATKACIDNRKKLLKQQYLLHMSSQYGERRPLTAEIGSVVWGTPANFNRFRVLAALLQRRRSTEANQTLQLTLSHLAWCLAVSWTGTLHIHFRRFLPNYEILTGAKFTFHPPTLALSYFGSVSVTARHLSSGREPSFAALSTCSLQGATYIRQGDHRVGHWPTF